MIAINAGANTVDVVQIGTANYYRLTYDANDQFNVNGGGSESLDQFESALVGMLLPDLDGPGGQELIDQSLLHTCRRRQRVPAEYLEHALASASSDFWDAEPSP